MNSFARRLVGAALLNRTTYEEIEVDRRATPQAVVVVLLSSVAAGLGSSGFGASRPIDVFVFTGIALLAWTAWAVLTYQIGIRVLPESQTRADTGQLLRTTGFASAPGLLRILGLVPALAAPVFIVSLLWMLLAMIVAVRHALDYTGTRRAVAVCVIGWSLALALAMALGILFGPVVS